MAHQYDSGLVAPIRRLVRQSVISKLTPLLRSSGKYVTSIVELPAPIRFGDADDERLINDLIQGASPAIAVALGRQGFTPQRTDALAWRGDILVAVYVFVRHQRSAMAGLAGDVVAAANDTKDPGIETLLEHIFARLAGVDTGIDEAPMLRPEGEEPAYFGTDWQVWEQTYRIATQLQINPLRDVVQVVSSIETRHQIDGSAAAPTTTITNLEAPT